MKKLLVLLFLFAILGCSGDDTTAGETLSAQENTSVENVFAYNLSEGARVLRQQERVTFFFVFDQLKWEEFFINDLTPNEEGFFEIQIMDRKFVLLKGGNFFELLDSDDSNEALNTLAVRTPRIGESESTNIFNFGVLSVHTSSAYEEVINGATLTYAADNIHKFLHTDSLGIARYWNANHLPWVEGEDGPGIGESLNVAFIEPSDHMLVLNGFVDLERRHLFKANNRVKRATIRSLDAEKPFEFEYEFSDSVEFSYIEFPYSVASVQLEIVEVYPGTRWDDTAITAIIRNHDWQYEDERLRQLIDIKTPENKYQGVSDAIY